MSRKMLLLADDELLIRRLVKPHLEKAGFETALAENGAEAFQLIMKQPPEVIILDIMMPEMDGMALLRLLKSMDSTKSIPVLLISMTYDDSVQKSAKALGAAGYLTKPFSPSQLLAEICRVCEVSKQDRGVVVKKTMSKELEACLAKWQQRGKFRVAN